MAGFAAYAFFYMDAVVEVDVVWKIVHLGPLNGFVRAVAFPHGLQRGTVDPDLRVAIHARLGGRHHGVLRVFHSRMAIPALNAHGADMVGMAERNWLFPRIALASRIGRVGYQFEKSAAQPAEGEHGENDTGAGE